MSDAMRNHPKPFHGLKALFTVTMMLFLLCACAPSDGNYSPLASTELKSATIEVTGPVEYSREAVDVFSYVACSDENVALSAGDDLIASRVGTQTIPFEATKGFFKRTEDLEFVIQDTRAPTVSFSESSVQIELGDPFDVESYVSGVADPIDGELARYDQKPAANATHVGLEQFYNEGWYTLTDSVDPNVPGDYEVVIEASDQHGNTVSETLPVTVTDPLEGVTLTPTNEYLEYGKETIDPTELVTCSIDDAILEAEKVIPDTIGKITVAYTVSKHKSSHEIDIEFIVRDTKHPKVAIKQEKITMEMGDDFDANSYVKDVSDPIDGKLSRVKKEPETKATKAGEEQFYESGWYYIDGKADVDEKGTYKLSVIACDKHGNKTTKQLTVVVKDPLEGVTLTPTSTTLEYSSKKTDATKLVTCSIEGAKVEAKKIDLSKVGKKKVKYTVTKGSSVHTVEVVFNVKDTKKPSVKLKDDEVTVDWNSDYDPYSNIFSVKDPVDGELERIAEESSEPGSGWYTITGSFDTNKPGKYFLTVVAQDCNGNKKSKEFALIVGERPQEPETQPVDNGRDYVLNTNTHKFHYPSCRDVNRIKDSNRMDVHATRDDVIAMGYSSCGHCHP